MNLTVVASFDPHIPQGAVLEATMRQPLTPSQRKVYAAVVDLHARHGRPPTYTELLEATGYASKSTIWWCLYALEAAGWIEPRSSGKGQVVPA
jgi:SOS-response transcriptional repressor LexA